MGVVLYHPEFGVFLGTLNGIPQWSCANSVGVWTGFIFTDAEEAFNKNKQSNLSWGDDPDYLECFDVETGNWEELQKMGLKIGDMAFNDPKNQIFAFPEKVSIH